MTTKNQHKLAKAIGTLIPKGKASSKYKALSEIADILVSESLPPFNAFLFMTGVHKENSASKEKG